MQTTTRNCLLFIAVALTGCGKAKGGKSAPCPSSFLDFKDAASGDPKTCTCAANATAGAVYGSDIYTQDSSLCAAAIHVGAIQAAAGGEVTVKSAPGCPSYLGLEKNGVMSSGWAKYPGSFFFVGKGEGKCTAAVATPLPTPPPTAAKNELTATYKGKTDGPLTPSNAIYSDDNNGNLQIFLLANCPGAPAGCGAMKYGTLDRDGLKKICPGWTMMFIPFSPEQQTVGMGPLKLTAGKYGKATAGIHAAMVEYSNADYSKGGQIYQDGPSVELTSATDNQLVGTFEAKKADELHYTGSFSATKCKCDLASGTCN